MLRETKKLEKMPPHFCEKTVSQRVYCFKCSLTVKNCKCKQEEEEYQDPESDTDPMAARNNRARELIDEMIADLDEFWETVENSQNPETFVRCIRILKIAAFFTSFYAVILLLNKYSITLEKEKRLHRILWESFFTVFFVLAFGVTWSIPKYISKKYMIFRNSLIRIVYTFFFDKIQSWIEKMDADRHRTLLERIDTFTEKLKSFECFFDSLFEKCFKWFLLAIKILIFVPFTFLSITGILLCLLCVHFNRLNDITRDRLQMIITYTVLSVFFNPKWNLIDKCVIKVCKILKLNL